MPDYELLRCVGRGAYRDVWLARNVLGQFRAVKFVYRNRFADPRQFEREFEGIQRFDPISRSHPSQLHILHVGKNDEAGCFYYVMELADAAKPRGNSESVISNQFMGWAYRALGDYGNAIDCFETSALIAGAPAAEVNPKLKHNSPIAAPTKP